ncbi:AbrB/MazE/SpoVT family DNA-binding domain-containing protein [Pyrobaculum sp.]|uniref:AbrB/MazE/SpoVT family DNA-binding domain-containing protein n=1 Tax=Pyrobaculum sp. TaxID=2004705 RepID=UPI0031667C8D
MYKPCRAVRQLGTSRIWGRGYTTVPVVVRKVLSLSNGDVLEWYMTEDGEIIVKKSGGSYVYSQGY